MNGAAACLGKVGTGIIAPRSTVTRTVQMACKRAVNGIIGKS